MVVISPCCVFWVIIGSRLIDVFSHSNFCNDLNICKDGYISDIITTLHANISRRHLHISHANAMPFNVFITRKLLSGNPWANCFLAVKFYASTWQSFHEHITYELDDMSASAEL